MEHRSRRIALSQQLTITALSLSFCDVVRAVGDGVVGAGRLIELLQTQQAPPITATANAHLYDSAPHPGRRRGTELELREFFN
jgi:hypothetical protein